MIKESGQKKLHRLCSEYDVEIIVMKHIKGGTLINVSDDVKNEFEDYTDETIASLALRFAGTQKMFQ